MKDSFLFLLVIVSAVSLYYNFQHWKLKQLRENVAWCTRSYDPNRAETASRDSSLLPYVIAAQKKKHLDEKYLFTDDEIDSVNAMLDSFQLWLMNLYVSGLRCPDIKYVPSDEQYFMYFLSAYLESRQGRQFAWYKHDGNLSELGIAAYKLYYISLLVSEEKGYFKLKYYLSASVKRQLDDSLDT